MRTLTDYEFGVLAIRQEVPNPVDVMTCEAAIRLGVGTDLQSLCAPVAACSRTLGNHSFRVVINKEHNQRVFLEHHVKSSQHRDDRILLPKRMVVDNQRP